MIASPCIKVCRMDADDHYCLGCKRTLQEIARWSRAVKEYGIKADF